MNAHKPITAACNPLSGSTLAGASRPSPALDGAPAIPQVVCDECGGTGEALFLALDGTRYEVGYCDPCSGTGLVDPVCQCGGALDARGWCSACEDSGLTDFIVAVDRNGVAHLSERRA